MRLNAIRCCLSAALLLPGLPVPAFAGDTSTDPTSPAVPLVKIGVPGSPSPPFEKVSEAVEGYLKDLPHNLAKQDLRIVIDELIEETEPDIELFDLRVIASLGRNATTGGEPLPELSGSMRVPAAKYEDEPVKGLCNGCESDITDRGKALYIFQDLMNTPLLSSDAGAFASLRLTRCQRLRTGDLRIEWSWRQMGAHQVKTLDSGLYYEVFRDYAGEEVTERVFLTIRDDAIRGFRRDYRGDDQGRATFRLERPGSARAGCFVKTICASGDTLAEDLRVYLKARMGVPVVRSSPEAPPVVDRSTGGAAGC